MDDMGAVLSPCGKYRYKLWRSWSSGPQMTWVMLNPSTADATQDDPTIRRCIGFAKTWGYGGLVVVNLFARRATDPRELKKLFANQATGNPENNQYILDAALSSSLTVAAWGQHGKLYKRSAVVTGFLGRRGVPLHVLRTTKDGTPSHPLYLPASLTPQLWKPQL